MLSPAAGRKRFGPFKGALKSNTSYLFDFLVHVLPHNYTSHRPWPDLWQFLLRCINHLFYCEHVFWPRKTLSGFISF